MDFVYAGERGGGGEGIIVATNARRINTADFFTSAFRTEIRLTKATRVTSTNLQQLRHNK